MKWLDEALVVYMHLELVREHGGAREIRDRGLLDSALARPKNLLGYDPDCTLSSLAAAYCFGIVKNHPFVDGNKRVGLMAMYTFLGMNGMELDASEEEAYDIIYRCAASEISELELAAWTDVHTKTDT